MRLFIGIIFTSLLAISCAGPRRSATARPSPTRTVVPENPVSDLAQREILRRQELIRQMDATALEASRSLSENDLEGAVSGFRRASAVAP
jgi:hypothetical protein